MVPFCNAVLSTLISFSGGGDSLAKSTVQPNGVPNSSFLAYFLPMDTLESSTLLAIPLARIFRATRFSHLATSGADEGMLTDVVDLGSQVWVLGDGHDEALDGCHERRKRQDLSVNFSILNLSLLLAGRTARALSASRAQYECSSNE